MSTDTCPQCGQKVPVTGADDRVRSLTKAVASAVRGNRDRVFAISDIAESAGIELETAQQLIPLALRSVKVKPFGLKTGLNLLSELWPYGAEAGDDCQSQQATLYEAHPDRGYPPMWLRVQAETDDPFRIARHQETLDARVGAVNNELRNEEDGVASGGLTRANVTGIRQEVSGKLEKQRRLLENTNGDERGSIG